MNPKLKKKWVKALMSGKYEQGENELYGGGKYCCLGVLGSVMGVDEGILLGMETLTALPKRYRVIPDDAQEVLAYMNDSGVPFPVIARFIQENL